MSVSTTGLNSLPTELIVQILGPFPSRSLICFALVSQRFYNIVLSILHLRLHAAATLFDHRLVLECFHPSAKFSTPSLLCDYIGTDAVSDDVPVGDQPSLSIVDAGKLARLANIYSHFRPVERESRRPWQWGFRTGIVPVTPDSGTTVQSENGSKSEKNVQKPSEIVSLESHELFAQLCGLANLVKVGPRNGIYASCVTIGGGVIRIWRQWLAENARSCERESRCEISNDAQSTAESEKPILWFGGGRNVGIRLRVIEIGLPVTLVLHGNGEDEDVSYTLEYEELLIRTSHLLLRVEDSIAQRTASTGKAVVFGAW